MPEFRQNLATRQWVILAPERGKRPSGYKDKSKVRKALPHHDKSCPFCAGNENQSDPPTYVYPQSGDWQVRSVPNKYAALKDNLTTKRVQEGCFLKADGFGIAEVIIEHPRHDLTIALMKSDEIYQMLYAYRERQKNISKDDRINLVTIFRNHGEQAGTSLAHPHSQIIATPIVPPHVRYPIEQAAHYYDMHGNCVFCDMITEELKQKKRIIADMGSFVAFCPFAARSPFEIQIFPKKHMASFLSINDSEIAELANVLRQVLGKCYTALDDPDYNYVIRSSPVGDEDTRYLHWYIMIIPKISIPAGFEIGSGIYINTVAPEDSAEFLRKIEFKASD